MTEKSNYSGLYVDADVHKAVSVFAVLEGERVKDFVGGVLREHLEIKYGHDLIQKVVDCDDPLLIIAALSVHQYQNGVPLSETLLGTLAKNDITNKKVKG